MGGNALKTISTPRISKEKYAEVESQVLKILSSKFTHLLVPRYFSTKETFGDMDIIVYPHIDDLKSLVTELFNPVEFYYNDKTLSFAYDMKDGTYFQIDIKTVKTLNELYICHFLQSYGDFTMILGSLCTQWNLKLTINGIYYRVFEDNKKENPLVCEVLLSDDIIKIGKFIGFNKNLMNDFFNGSGSQDLPEEEFFYNLNNSPLMTSSHILKFITKSKISNPGRTMLGRFGDFILMQSLKKSNLTIDKILAYFDKTHEVEYRILQYKIRKMATKKMREMDVSSITGLKTKKLGHFIHKMYQSVPEFNDSLWILSTSEKEISHKISNFYISQG